MSEIELEKVYHLKDCDIVKCYRNSFDEHHDYLAAKTARFLYEEQEQQERFTRGSEIQGCTLVILSDMLYTKFVNYIKQDIYKSPLVANMNIKCIEKALLSCTVESISEEKPDFMKKHPQKNIPKKGWFELEKVYHLKDCDIIQCYHNHLDANPLNGNTSLIKTTDFLREQQGKFTRGSEIYGHNLVLLCNMLYTRYVSYMSRPGVPYEYCWAKVMDCNRISEALLFCTTDPYFKFKKLPVRELSSYTLESCEKNKDFYQSFEFKFILAISLSAWIWSVYKLWTR